MGWRPLPAKEDIMSNTTIFQVLKNLVFTADITAASLETKVSRKTGTSYQQFSTPIYLGGVRAGDITAFVPKAPKLVLRDGEYKPVFILDYEYKAWVSLKEEDLGDYKMFYEGDQNQHHVKGYSKGGITIWAYTDIQDKKEAGLIRAQIVLRTRGFALAK